MPRGPLDDSGSTFEEVRSAVLPCPKFEVLTGLRIMPRFSIDVEVAICDNRAKAIKGDLNANASAAAEQAWR